MKRPGERLAEVHRRRLRVQLDHQLANRGAGQASVQQGDEEGNRGEPDDDERRSLDREEEELLGEEGAGDQEHRAHHQGEREGVDEQRGGAAERACSGPPTSHEHADPAKQEGGEGGELDLRQGRGGVGLGDDREHVLGIEAAEHQPEQLQADGDRVARDHQNPLQPALEHPRREGQVDVQEDREREQVAGLADRRRQRRARRREARERGQEAAGHHQRPETTLGSPPPGDQPAEDVRADDPVEQGGLEAGLRASVVAVQPQYDRAGGRDDAGERDAPEHRRPRRCKGSPRAVHHPDPNPVPVPRKHGSGHSFLSESYRPYRARARRRYGAE